MNVAVIAEIKSGIPNVNETHPIGNEIQKQKQGRHLNTVIQFVSNISILNRFSIRLPMFHFRMNRIPKKRERIMVSINVSISSCYFLFYEITNFNQ